MADDFKGRDGSSDDFKSDDFNPDDAHFSDEELEAALAGFEKEFADADASEDAGANDDSSANDDSVGSHDSDAPEVPDVEAGFDDELQGLLGNKAKVAVIITQLASADLLAAFCQLSDISAKCVASKEGAVAVLDNLNGDGPEAAAKDLTTVVSGMAVVLAVNRADKLEANLYLHGKPGESFVPPVLFSSTAPFVEDLMLGITNLDALQSQGFAVTPTSKFDRDAAFQVIAQHTKFGRGARTE